ncbi:hypothetical protein F4820DRAFT_56057 [Hypoxylon rubiginosum]|uniref:Uncharacterized protein n=1 Tax=Hypoxylon rubiginosum TaxID=110542 RepID=A0ACB9YR14_9PEZI|nr:hypothetical protein F4820DRAFT_56057 [Hypoxylon rubiginosum]
MRPETMTCMERGLPMGISIRYLSRLAARSRSRRNRIVALPAEGTVESESLFRKSLLLKPPKCDAGAAFLFSFQMIMHHARTMMLYEEPKWLRFNPTKFGLLPKVPPLVYACPRQSFASRAAVVVGELFLFLSLFPILQRFCVPRDRLGT